MGCEATFHIQATFKMLTEEEKITYLSGNLNLLAENIKMMEPIEEYRPRTVNLTWAYSREKEKIVRYMFGASIRCGQVPQSKMVQDNKSAREERVKAMRILQWASNIALTPEQSKSCKHHLGNRYLGKRYVDKGDP